MNKPIFKYIAALLLFGSNGIAASMISMSSYGIVMFRTMTGSLFLIVLYLITNKEITFYRHKKSFLYLLLSGIAMGVSWLFLYEAYQQIGVSIASLGYYCGPVIVMSISPILFNEHYTKQMVISFLIVFTGILFVNGNAFHGSHNGYGIFCSLMSALMYAAMVSFNKKAEKIIGLENSALQLTAAFLSVFIYTAIIRQGIHLKVHSSDIAPLLFLGLINTGIGCFLYFSSISSIKVQTVAVLGYLEPLSAVVFSFIFLHERLLSIQAAGAVLIIMGAINAQIKWDHTE